MPIQKVIEKRGIKFLVHFTRLENLDNILRNGIIPRSDMKDEFVNPCDFLSDDNKENSDKYIYNDHYRYDGKCDYSCLSINFPNDLMFYKLRIDNPNSKWAIIFLSTETLLSYDCLFYPCNAASGDVSHQDISNYQGAKALDAMFQNNSNYPQDVQAEVMVKGIIEPKYIIGCAFSEQEYVDKYKAVYPNLEFISHSNGQGFFGKREWTKIGY